MLQNAAQTNLAEAGDLLNFRLLGYFVMLGVLPAIAIARLPLRWRGIRVEAIARGKLLAGCRAADGWEQSLAFGGFYAPSCANTNHCAPTPTLATSSTRQSNIPRAASRSRAGKS
jgi:hypothetical protein